MEGLNLAHLAAGLGYFSYVDLDTPFFIRDETGRHPYLSARGVYDLRAVRQGIGIVPIIAEDAKATGREK